MTPAIAWCLTVAAVSFPIGAIFHNVIFLRDRPIKGVNRVVFIVSCICAAGAIFGPVGALIAWIWSLVP